MVFLAVIATVPPAAAAPGTITVDNVDSLRVAAGWGLGPEPVYYRSAIDADDWYLMAFATPDDRAWFSRLTSTRGGSDGRSISGAPAATWWPAAAWCSLWIGTVPVTRRRA